MTPHEQAAFDLIAEAKDAAWIAYNQAEQAATQLACTHPGVAKDLYNAAETSKQVRLQLNAAQREINKVR